jgi:hypothetical protein
MSTPESAGVRRSSGVDNGQRTGERWAALAASQDAERL